MDSKRRFFIKSGALATGALFLNNPFQSFASKASSSKQLSRYLDDIHLVHTKEMNGNIRTMDLPFSAMLLDAGNFMPSNTAEQSEAVHRMNQAGYRAVTLGKEELIRGQAELGHALENASFHTVNCNYEFSHSLLKEKIKPYCIIPYGRFKVGVTGVGAKTATEGIFANNPYHAANEAASFLKKDEKCDLVICISALSGNKKDDTVWNNYKLAKGSRCIDAIIGDTNYTSFHGPFVLRNDYDEEVILSGNGAASFSANKLIYSFTKEFKTGFSHQLLC